MSSPPDDGKLSGAVGSPSSGSFRKAKGNALMKDGKFAEAILEYTEGIASEPANPVFYSNRSLAFLRVEQYYFALKDAETTIRLVPDWPKGYYRKGQAEEAADMFERAADTYKQGLKHCTNDPVLERSLQDVQKQAQKYMESKRMHVKKYAIIAGVIGAMLSIADAAVDKQYSFIRHPWQRWILVTLSAVFGSIIATVQVSFQKSSRHKRLNPPNELMTREHPDYIPAIAMGNHGDSAKISDVSVPLKARE